MRYLNLFYFLVIVTFANPALSQDADEVVDQEPTTVEALLALVKEGKVKEQAENARREAVFLADKNKQASILAAEKRELARQERIADKLEAEYKANQEILRVKEEAYKKELGSLVELFGHLQSSAGESSSMFANSLTSAEFGLERVAFLNELTGKMSETTKSKTNWLLAVMLLNLILL